MALPAKYRLPLRFERDRVTREGKTYHTQFFTIVKAPLASNVAGSQTGRFAILLSKKTAKLATDRNYIKRRVSVCLQELLASFPPADYLVIPKRATLEASQADLVSDLKAIISS